MKITNDVFDLLIAGDVCGFDTRKDQLNAAIRDFIALAKGGHNINDNVIQETVLFYNDLTNLTEKEATYIAHMIMQEGGLVFPP